MDKQDEFIRTVKDLQHWLYEDKKRNNMDIPYWKYLAKYFTGNENAVVVHYLNVLRHCEYHFNNQGLYHKILYWFYKIRKNKLSIKYGIHIPINRTGYGLRMMHISGGGSIEC